MQRSGQHQSTPRLISRLLVVTLFVAMLGGLWDAWWHAVLGRDSFWQPPHLLIYSTVALSIGLGIYGWYVTRQALWRRLAIIMVVMLSSAPIDNLWHEIFGIESVNSPMIVWSPPHLLLIFSTLLSVIGLLPLVRLYNDTRTQRFFDTLLFPVILALSLFVFAPIQPTGPWPILGFWATGIISFVMTLIILFAQRIIPGIAKATSVMLVFVAINAIAFSDTPSGNIFVAPATQPPAWLTIFALLAAAVVLDLLDHKSFWLRGVVFGLVWSLLLYGFAWYFFAQGHQYGLVDGVIAIFTGTLGGLVAGQVRQIIHRRLHETHR